ncbi:GATA transcription factor 4-like [Telopea speciosissima]|uniref:GATA transcription factor 4-like n=1 Tax=Telopea speciosissima TaxID=54955 RepID=UPI001CC45634|nr:GATA transcription factor 4-like [Telopea speciosissima]
MDMYGLPAPDFFHIEDLLDFSNDDIFSSSTTLPNSDINHHQNHLPRPENPAGDRPSSTSVNYDDSISNSNQSNNFTDDLCVPSDDIAELEWLSKFVDDSFIDLPMNEIAETNNFRLETSVPGRARSKRSRAASTQRTWTSLPEYGNLVTGKYKLISNITSQARNRESSSSVSPLMMGEQSSPSPSSSSSSSSGEVRKCTHCASEKTPQWRTGPLGPKTLCNACGVRYKSGRLVPEYRPAASPTFVLTQHSNSHRKVMELRRQKENLRQEESGSHHQHQQQQQLLYHHHHHHHNHHDVKIC